MQMFASKHMTTALFFCTLFYMGPNSKQDFEIRKKNENISMKPESLKPSRSIEMIKSDLFVNPILRKI